MIKNCTIFIDENEAGTVVAYGSHDDLIQDEVKIEAEYSAGEKRCGFNWFAVPSKCEITALYIQIRTKDDPIKIDRCHFGANVIEDWECAIMDKIEEVD